MSYQSRIREIQSSFVMGFQDRETCISMFESLLHEHDMLPKEEQLDRTITNETFLALLKMAKEHKSWNDAPSEHNDPSLKKIDDLRRAEESLKRLTRWMEQMAKGVDQQYRIADSIKQHCPVCQKPISALFNRVQSLDQQMLTVDPPRCQECMTKWVNERFTVKSPEVRFTDPPTADGTPASPMSPSEADFFAEYEKQMEKS